MNDSALSPLSLTVSQARFYGGAKHSQMKSKAPSVKAVIMASPPGTSSCVETLGERHQRCPALNHMCNQSKLTARRQVR